MARRGYSNVASTLSLVGSLDGVSVTNTVNVSVTPAGWPGSLPYFAVIDPTTASEELVLVTAASGTSLTFTRGASLAVPYGSVTRTHSNGALIKHVASAADYDEANAHLNTGAAVHGLAGSVVGTSDVQTLTNKIATFLSNAIGTCANVIRAMAGQTANLTEWQNSSAVAQSSVGFDGHLRLPGGGVISIEATSLAGPTIFMDTGLSSGARAVVIPARTATDTPLALRGAASQTGNLQEWQNSSGTTLINARPDGRLGFLSSLVSNSTTHPAGGAPALPATPAGYISVILDGTTPCYMPYYF